jgi:hypothetical protein
MKCFCAVLFILALGVSCTGEDAANDGGVDGGDAAGDVAVGAKCAACTTGQICLQLYDGDCVHFTVACVAGNPAACVPGTCSAACGNTCPSPYYCREPSYKCGSEIPGAFACYGI